MRGAIAARSLTERAKSMTDVVLSLSLDGTPPQDVASLSNHISILPGVRPRSIQAPPSENSLGAVELLEITLSSAAVVTFAKCLFEYLKQRYSTSRPEVKLTLNEVRSGRSFAFEARNADAIVEFARFLDYLSKSPSAGNAPTTTNDNP